MNRPMLLIVRDQNGHEWCFTVRADPTHLHEWRAAGLDVCELAATIPAWVAASGMSRPWVAVQAAWQWLRVF